MPFSLSLSSTFTDSLENRRSKCRSSWEHWVWWNYKCQTWSCQTAMFL